MTDYSALKEKHLAALGRRVMAITNEQEDTLTLADQLAIIEALTVLERVQNANTTAIDITSYTSGGPLKLVEKRIGKAKDKTNGK